MWTFVLLLPWVLPILGEGLSLDKSVTSLPLMFLASETRHRVPTSQGHVRLHSAHCQACLILNILLLFASSLNHPSPWITHMHTYAQSTHITHPACRESFMLDLHTSIPTCSVIWYVVCCDTAISIVQFEVCLNWRGCGWDHLRGGGEAFFFIVSFAAELIH